MVDALRDRVGRTAQRDGPFRRVWQHFARDLDRAAGDLADLLDLGATLTWRIEVEKSQFRI